VATVEYVWYHLRMVRTTVYLPENTKQRLSEAARREGQSEAEFIRSAIERRVSEVLPRARGRWGTIQFDERGLAHKVDEVLAEGFGQELSSATLAASSPPTTRPTRRGQSFGTSWRPMRAP
jgi:predicted transcriptional regulator